MICTAASAVAQCTQWSAFGAGVNNTVLAVAAPGNGNVIAGGVFTQAGSVPANRIARWNGAAWVALGAGVDGSVRALTTLPNGDLIAAGDFTTAGGDAANRIARWDGANWAPLGAGVSSPSGLFGLYAVATMPNGDVVAGGYFTMAGGAPANAIARWNGTTWSPLGSGILATVFALTVLPNGDLIAGGNFSTAGGIPASRVARWNGTTWAPLGTGIDGFRVDCVVAMPNGDLVVGGNFTAAGGVPASRIARWNGATWSPLGSGMDGDVKALVAMPNGDLIAGGQFTTAGGVAANGCARWNGSVWAPLGFGGGAQVYAMAVAPEGERVAGGFFSTAGGVSAGRIARYQSTCPATAANTGAGCPGSGGANDYAATTVPWIGTAYRAGATGVRPAAIAIVVSSFATTNQPLASVLPPSPAGCTLLVAPDVADVVLPNAGVVDTQIPIPGNAVLVGAILHQQLVLLDVDPVTQTSIQNTVSNRLTATVGRF